MAIAAVAACACGGAKAAYRSKAVPAASAPLDRSVFARDPNGQLSEDALQRVLASELELDLPARIGVLPVVDAVDWRGPSPSYDPAPAALAPLVRGLRGDEPFFHVTEMMAIPSGALGMEALREIAARYHLRYVLLYRESIATRERANPWAIGYATIVGALFLPGDTLSVDGYVEASLLDVKTGLLLFTVRRRVSGRRRTNVWHTGDKLADLRRRAAERAAPSLAKDVRQAVYEFERAARFERQRRHDTARPAEAAAGTSEAVAPDVRRRGAGTDASAADTPAVPSA
ncbi:MAG: hypothetical protein D6689_21705 [Deltaproteobacteria bacterium]|nr:MAG: hypothetical protein D6689_21705 [Deltaproteobacteria bacterium]